MSFLNGKIHNNSKIKFQNILLLIFSIVIALILCELIAGLVYSARHPLRYLMWSSPNLKLTTGGAVTFATNEYIREVVVYNEKIEYDTFYKTNNLGSVDNVDYNSSETHNSATRLYAFVGDSFTAGSGVSPCWVTELRGKLLADKKNIMIYNFGIPGTGIKHFLKILEANLERFKFTDIVILALSDDMTRRYWVPIAKNGKVYFCATPEEDCLRTKGPIATIIDKNATRNDILAHARLLKQGRVVPRSVPGCSSGNLFQESKLIRLASSHLWRGSIKNSNYISNIDFEPLRTIRSLFPSARVFFIHLPVKEEIKNGKYNLELKNYIEALGIKYYPALSMVSWDRSMFYEHDSHPNNRGYMNISDCVEKILYMEDKQVE